MDIAPQSLTSTEPVFLQLPESDAAETAVVVAWMSEFLTFVQSEMVLTGSRDVLDVGFRMRFTGTPDMLTANQAIDWDCRLTSLREREMALSHAICMECGEKNPWCSSTELLVFWFPGRFQESSDQHLTRFIRSQQIVILSKPHLEFSMDGWQHVCLCSTSLGRRLRIWSTGRHLSCPSRRSIPGSNWLDMQVWGRTCCLLNENKWKVQVHLTGSHVPIMKML